MRHKWWSAVAAGASLGALALSGLAMTSQASATSPRLGMSASGGNPSGVHGIAGGTTGLAAGNKFCANLGKKYEASSGAQMFCFGSQLLAGHAGCALYPF